MSVGYNDTLDFLSVLLKIGEIGNNKVNSEHICLGEGKTAVDYYDIVLKFINRNVLTDLVKSAEEAYLNGFRGHFLALLPS